MTPFNFVTVRLGKDSISEINKISTSSVGLQENPFQIVVNCTQIPDNYATGDYAFIWLGSDNNKGAKTKWKQGFKAVGKVLNIRRGKSYNDSSETILDICFIFRDAVSRMDILRCAPEAYYWCASFPLIGLDDHANQTIRLMGGNSFSDIKAFFYAMDKTANDFKSNILKVEPGFKPYFVDVIPSPKENPAAKSLSEVNGQIVPRKLKYPLQQIFYGAPGTGKSNTIKSEVDEKGLPCVRTTFHPDSDYSTFVGAYKPVMEECDVKVTPIVTNNGVSLQPSGTYKERRITYKFVKQAFLKAYLGAWKKYVDGGSSSSQRQGLSLTATNGDEFLLVEVGKDYVGHTKESRIKVSQFETAVKDYWKKNLIPNNPDKWKWYESLVCDWYYDPEDEQTAEGCWEAFKKELNDNNNTFRCEKPNQIYLMKLDGDNITISTIIVKNARKRAIQNVYDSNDLQGYSIQATIAQKLQEYGGTFEEAWEKLKNEVEARKSSSANTSDSNAVLPQFLIIEEINRGNCAQIFGDLFQLLDRGENGFSEYPIEADTDLQQEIARVFREEDEYKLSSNIDIEGEVKCYKSNYEGKTLSEDVQEGRVLLLPPNLFIWATMNTSDQSLFPIDSAFKRRWDWEYMPIGYKNEDWKIEIGEKEYKWVDFQHEINDRIYSIDNSEDKQLGDFFVNANLTGQKISSDVLLNKILFYLWNDVCKDDPEQIFRWKDEKDNNQEKSIKFSEFFCKKEDKERKLQGFMAFLGINADGGAGEKVEQKDEATAGNDDVVNS